MTAVKRGVNGPFHNNSRLKTWQPACLPSLLVASPCNVIVWCSTTATLLHPIFFLFRTTHYCVFSLSSLHTTQSLSFAISATFLRFNSLLLLLQRTKIFLPAWEDSFDDIPFFLSLTACYNRARTLVALLMRPDDAMLRQKPQRCLARGEKRGGGSEIKTMDGGSKNDRLRPSPF